jgi:hypothetical protein
LPYVLNPFLFLLLQYSNTILSSFSKSLSLTLTERHVQAVVPVRARHAGRGESVPAGGHGPGPQPPAGGALGLPRDVQDHPPRAGESSLLSFCPSFPFAKLCIPTPWFPYTPLSPTSFVTSYLLFLYSPLQHLCRPGSAAGWAARWSTSGTTTCPTRSCSSTSTRRCASVLSDGIRILFTV